MWQRNVICVCGRSILFCVNLACVASVSVGLGSKERPRNGTGTVFCPREIGARAKIRKRPLNPTETLATQAIVCQENDTTSKTSWPFELKREIATSQSRLTQGRTYVRHKVAHVESSSLRPIYTVRLCRIRQACDRPTTWIVSSKSTLQLAYDCCLRQKNCRRILKHVLKRSDNRSRE